MSYYHNVEEVLDRTSRLFEERGLLDRKSHLILDGYPFSSYAEFFGIELPKLFLKENSSFTSRLAVPVIDSPMFKRGKHKRKPLYGEYTGSLDMRDADVQLPSGLIISYGVAELLGVEAELYEIPEEGITSVLVSHGDTTESEPHFLAALVSWKSRWIKIP